MSAASIISKLQVSGERAKKLLPASIILILSIVFFHSILSSSKVPDNIHYINDVTFSSEHMRKFLHEGYGFPLWTPYFYAGQPFLAIPEQYLFDLNFLFVWAFNNIVLSMNLALIAYFFLAGLGMYFFIRTLLEKEWPALIGAILYMFNGFVTSFIITGHLNLMEGYALIPWGVLLIHLALSKENWPKYAIGAGTILSLMVLSGSIIFLLYTLIIIAAYMLISLIGHGIAPKILKSVKIVMVVGIVLFGLSAIKLMPTLEFVKMSSRSMGVSYQEFLGYPIELLDALQYLVFVGGEGFTVSMGVFGVLLLVLGLLQIRKKAVLFAGILVMIGILLASGGFLAKTAYLLPGFSQMRHIERALLLVAFAAPILSAYGSSLLFEKMRKKYPGMKGTVIGITVFSIVLIELLVFSPWPSSVDVVHPTDIPLVAEVSKDTSPFKVATHAMDTPIGASGYNYYVQLGIPEVKGGGGIWIPEYVQYLAFAQAQDPATLFGMLGAKYIIAKNELNVPGIELKKKFDECEGCSLWEAYGPYLYENKKALPSAFFAKKSVLLVGSERSKRDASYSLLSMADPGVALIVGKEGISGYSSQELENYDSILLLEGSFGQSDVQKLEQFEDRGGMIVPDVLNGELSITEEKLREMLGEGEDGVPTGLEMKRDSFDSFSIEIDEESDWLILTERVAYFPGWSAELNGNRRQIERSNAVISAVHVGGEQGKIVFSYYPPSYKKGVWITSLTIMVLMIMMGFDKYRKIFERRKTGADEGRDEGK